MRISHEAIYQALFVQARGALRRELTACLRTGRALRMPRARTRRRGKTFISPQIMGSDAVPAFKGMPAPIPMAQVEVERYGNDLGLSSLLKDPWPPTQLA